MPGLREQVASLEADSRILETNTLLLTSLNEEDLERFPRPGSVRDTCEGLGFEILKSVSEWRQRLMDLQASRRAPHSAEQPVFSKRLDVLQLVERVNGVQEDVDHKLNRVREACHRLRAAKTCLLAQALRGEAQRRGVTTNEFFKQLAGGKEEEGLPHEVLFQHIMQSAGSEWHVEHLQLVCSGSASGYMSLPAFLCLAHDYFSCAREVPLTSGFDMNRTQILRKIRRNELVELLEDRFSGGMQGLRRIRCRCVTDGLEGWITLRPPLGMPFLIAAEKPLLTCNEDLQLEADEAGGAVAARMLRAEEGVELLLGPQERTSRAKVRAFLDGAEGWLKASPQQLRTFSPYYRCVRSVALYSTLPTASAATIRCLDVGEEVLLEAGPKVDAGSSRLKVTASRDGASGWAMLKDDVGAFLEGSGRSECSQTAAHSCG